MINSMCLVCKNWESEKCNDCLSINKTGQCLKPQDIEFKNYDEYPLTLKQYKKRTGKKWPIHNAIYSKMIWETATKEDLRHSYWGPSTYGHSIADYYPMVCALGFKRPSKNWLPEGYIIGSRKPH